MSTMSEFIGRLAELDAPTVITITTVAPACFKPELQDFVCTEHQKTLEANGLTQHTMTFLKRIKH